MTGDARTSSTTTSTTTSSSSRSVTRDLHVEECSDDQEGCNQVMSLLDDEFFADLRLQETKRNKGISNNNDDIGLIDSQYFDKDVLASYQNVKELHKKANQNLDNHLAHSGDMADLGFIDRQFLYGDDTTATSPSLEGPPFVDTVTVTEPKTKSIVSDLDKEDLNYFDQLMFTEDLSTPVNDAKVNVIPDHRLSSIRVVFDKPLPASKLKSSSLKINKNNTTLEDQKINQKFKDCNKMDREARTATKTWQKGKSKLDLLVPDLDTEPDHMVVDLLMENILYQDEQLICLNKPYRLASQGGPGLTHSVSKYLDEMSRVLKVGGPLYLCHRLDRDTTGTLLIAKNSDMAVNIKRQFEQGAIYKRYLTITKGVPDPKSGTLEHLIDTEAVIRGSYYRCQLLPLTAKVKRQGVCTAKTSYKVLKKCDSAALVSLCPYTGRKHQLRVQLADALHTPILGDHKYSHRDRLAPQKLPEDILKSFKLTASKTRLIPMHLHSSELEIRDYKGLGKNLTITAELPLFFRRTIKILKLRA